MMIKAYTVITQDLPGRRNPQVNGILLKFCTVPYAVPVTVIFLSKVAPGGPPNDNTYARTDYPVILRPALFA